MAYDILRQLFANGPQYVLMLLCFAAAEFLWGILLSRLTCADISLIFIFSAAADEITQLLFISERLPSAICDEDSYRRTRPAWVSLLLLIASFTLLIPAPSRHEEDFHIISQAAKAACTWIWQFRATHATDEMLQYTRVFFTWCCAHSHDSRSPRNFWSPLL